MRTHCLLWNFFVNYLISGFNFCITPFLFGDRTYHIIIYFVGNIYRLFSWSLRNILKYSDCKCLIWRLISKLELYFLVLFFFSRKKYYGLYRYIYLICYYYCYCYYYYYYTTIFTIPYLSVKFFKVIYKICIICMVPVLYFTNYGKKKCSSPGPSIYLDTSL